jgi:hypothetical protein
MSNIKPISDLKNYTEVLMDDLDQLKAMLRLLAFLGEGERSGKEEGWLSTAEVEASLGL